MHLSNQFKIHLIPTGGVRNDNTLDAFRLMCQQGEMFDHLAPCLKIWHQFDLGYPGSLGKGKYFAWPIFELDTFDEKEKHHLKYPDSLIVCSEWAKDVIKQNGILQEVYVVPLGVDTSVFNYKKVIKSDNKDTIFFHAGKWEVRKGHDFMVDWFNSAFETTDNVQLWLMPHNPFLKPDESQAWAGLYMNSPMGKAGRITIVPWQPTQNHVSDVMAQTDCGLFPARAEGWNLELLEMMAMNKAIITTNYSAHTEFCNTDNALLIECNDLEPAYDGKWFFEQGNWAVIGDKQKEQGIQYMRLIHKSKQEGKDISNLNGLAMAQSLTWKNTIERLANVIYTNDKETKEAASNNRKLIGQAL